MLQIENVFLVVPMNIHSLYLLNENKVAMQSQHNETSIKFIHRNYNLNLTLLSARLNKSFAAVSENVSSGGGHPSGFEIKFSKIFFSFSSIGIVASSELGSISGLNLR